MQEAESYIKAMKLSLIDTHCDTAFELYHKKEGLVENSCHVSLGGAAKYENYTQFFAVWANRKRSDDECFAALAAPLPAAKASKMRVRYTA